HQLHILQRVTLRGLRRALRVCRSVCRSARKKGVDPPMPAATSSVEVMYHRTEELLLDPLLAMGGDGKQMRKDRENYKRLRRGGPEYRRLFDQLMAEQVAAADARRPDAQRDAGWLQRRMVAAASRTGRRRRAPASPR